MMISRTIYLLITQLFLVHVYGQNASVFDPPLKIPMYLSGNFGEIRADHFHSGIDIKTQGSTGHPVYSVERGHVSRIKVQANGYGKSIYIAHPNGTTSVYGHLDQYQDDIAAYVKNIQYSRHSHEVDMYLGAETFPVEKGEIIAYSGNTGGSSGPHLHFEIRQTSSQHPTNVLKYPFDIRDQVAPRFHSVHVYPMNEQSWVNGTGKEVSSPLVKDQGIYTLPWGTRLKAGGTVGISVQVFDYLNGASNRCGIYSLEMYVDDVLTYRHVMDEFSFSDTRYVNAHMDYQIYSASGIRAHRLHRLPNNRLGIYDPQAGNRPLVLDQPGTYKVRVVAADVAGNRSELQFSIQGDTATRPARPREADFIRTIRYNQATRYENEELSLVIPARALYRDHDLTLSSSPASRGSLGPFFQVGSSEIPLQQAFTLSIKCPPLAPALHNKLLLISLDDDGEIVSAGGDFTNGSVVASLRNFGPYAIGLDTIAPVILPRNGSMKGDLSGRKQLSFTIRDNLSGIEKYEGYIDSRWVLFEYDPKNELLFYSFDGERIQKGSEHELELYVTDARGNSNLFHTTFTW